MGFMGLASCAPPFFLPSPISIFCLLLFVYSYSKGVGLSSLPFRCQLVCISHLPGWETLFLYLLLNYTPSLECAVSVIDMLAPPADLFVSAILYTGVENNLKF